MSKRHKIIIVEDNQYWLETLNAILASTYDINLFADPREAVKSLKENKYQLAILDKNLPGTSGIELLKEMRTAAPGIRAIILTGYADVDSAVESMKIGASDYMSKSMPDLPTVLIARIEEALASDRGGAESITDLITGGESAMLEFKSSARWDFRANKLNKDLEWVIVKTVGAFLNSENNCNLLIGISDDGTVIGVE
jgi:DNA-binding NtrC family response regulator